MWCSTAHIRCSTISFTSTTWVILRSKWFLRVGASPGESHSIGHCDQYEKYN